MSANITQIKHSELFSSVESFLEFISPKNIEGDEKKLCRPYLLPKWHPFSIRGMGLIASSKELEDGQIQLIIAFPVNGDIPFETSVANNWMLNEKFITSFDKMAEYFVNGTQFGVEGRGTAEIIEGPKEFTFTWKESVKPLCEECEECESKENQ